MVYGHGFLNYEDLASQTPGEDWFPLSWKPGEKVITHGLREARTAGMAPRKAPAGSWVRESREELAAWCREWCRQNRLMPDSLTFQISPPQQEMQRDGRFYWTRIVEIKAGPRGLVYTVPPETDGWWGKVRENFQAFWDALLYGPEGKERPVVKGI